jgi:putative tricarboxylic transport membrane protein
MSAQDPDRDADGPVVRSRSVDTAVLLLLLVLAALLGWDSTRTGMGWASDGPEAGYFPFYLSLIMALACLYGLAVNFACTQQTGAAFVTRMQFRRVLQVFVPTLLFVVLIQIVGLYLASFLLVAGFMAAIGKIPLWKSVLVSLVFSIAMFLTFEIAFNVIMPKGPLEAAFGF